MRKLLLIGCLGLAACTSHREDDAIARLAKGKLEEKSIRSMIVLGKTVEEEKSRGDLVGTSADELTLQLLKLKNLEERMQLLLRWNIQNEDQEAHLSNLQFYTLQWVTAEGRLPTPQEAKMFEQITKRDSQN